MRKSIRWLISWNLCLVVLLAGGFFPQKSFHLCRISRISSPALAITGPSRTPLYERSMLIDGATLQHCKGLAVASAYFEYDGDQLSIHMSTGYQPWKSYTPFTPGTARCSLLSQMGSLLSTYKHYSRCSVPSSNIPLVGEINFSILDTDNSTICSIKAIQLHKRLNRPHHKVSALTTVKNSASYFREWFNYHVCTGWSHFYIYDDSSDHAMREVLDSLMPTGFVTYINWSHVRHGSRQFMAMQDFLIRFREETEYVAQMDDDCYFIAAPNCSNKPLSTFSQIVDDYFATARKDLCQIQLASYWFGHSWVERRTKPLVLSTFLRANTSLDSKTVKWQDASGMDRDVDMTLSIAVTKNISAASGITHRWDMNLCETMPVYPPQKMYFAHYKMKPLHEKSSDTGGAEAWGGYQNNRRFWNFTAELLHQVQDRTMYELDKRLNLSYTLTSTKVQSLKKYCPL